MKNKMDAGAQKNIEIQKNEELSAFHEDWFDGFVQQHEHKDLRSNVTVMDDPDHVTVHSGHVTGNCDNRTGNCDNRTVKGGHVIVSRGDITIHDICDVTIDDVTIFDDQDWCGNIIDNDLIKCDVQTNDGETLFIRKPTHYNKRKFQSTLKYDRMIDDDNDDPGVYDKGPVVRKFRRGCTIDDDEDNDLSVSIGNKSPTIRKLRSGRIMIERNLLGTQQCDSKIDDEPESSIDEDRKNRIEDDSKMLDIEDVAMPGEFDNESWLIMALEDGNLDKSDTEIQEAQLVKVKRMRKCKKVTFECPPPNNSGKIHVKNLRGCPPGNEFQPNPPQIQAQMERLIDIVLNFKHRNGRMLSAATEKLSSNNDMLGYDEITNLLDLEKIKKGVQDHKYRCLEDLEGAIYTFCHDAQLYNAKGTPIYEDSIVLQSVLAKAMEKMMKVSSDWSDDLSNDDLSNDDLSNDDLSNDDLSNENLSDDCSDSLDDASSCDSSKKILSYGSLVWAKFSRRTWPAIVINGELCGLHKPDNKYVWVMWFGEHLVSKVLKSGVKSFVLHFHDYFKDVLAQNENAVIEALQVCARRVGLRKRKYKSVKEWALSKNGITKLLELKEDPFAASPGSEYPVEVLEVMEEMREVSVDSQDTDTDSEMESVIELSEETQDNNLPVCFACCVRKVKTGVQHPLFDGVVCLHCLELLKERLLALWDNGYYKFCVVCCQGKTGYICCKKDCGRMFCSRCMKRHLSPSAITNITAQTTWTCLLCADYTLETHGSLQPMANWQERLVRFFNPVGNRPDVPAVFTGRRIRVLSLYDGIGIVKYVLEALGLDIEVYYYVEDDDAATRVTEKHNRTCGFSHYIGSINKLTKTKLEKICPIDLVVANPPNEDIDTETTEQSEDSEDERGCDIFRVMTILCDLQALCRGNTVYWLLEGSPTISSDWREYTSNLFEVPYCMWDAHFMSPYICPRLFWGNIPGLNQAVQFYKKHKTSQFTIKKYLDAKRKSRINALRSCAIDCPPMLSVDEMNCKTMIDATLHLKPIKEDGDYVQIRVEEVEKILGLPENYTFVEENSLEVRQGLLKKAPSVFILKHLLKPLTKMFVTK